MEKIHIKDKHRLNLLENARQREMSIIQSAISITENKLKEFEDKFQTSSEIFYSQYLKGEWGDDFDIMLWASEFQALNKLKHDYTELAEVQFVA